MKEAIVEVQKVAASINEIEQEALQQEQQQFILKEIENFIEGLVELVQPDRLKFLTALNNIFAWSVVQFWVKIWDLQINFKLILSFCTTFFQDLPTTRTSHSELRSWNS